MLCTWLLAALVATAPAIQEAASPQPPSPPASVRPSGSDTPFARLFRFGSDDPKTGVQAPRFRIVPGNQPVRANDQAPVDGESVEIICGMSVARKSAQIDRGIALPADRGKGVAVRRVEPGLCGPGRAVVPRSR